jgi:hypothetical protein
MTLEPRMLAVEERLQRLSSAMPAPDASAGWASLSAQLDPPLAPVIPLRPRRFRRPIVLAAAAALLVAGSAFAAITHGEPQHTHIAPPAGAIAGSGWGGPQISGGLPGRPAVAPTASDPAGNASPGQASSAGPSAAAGGAQKPEANTTPAKDDPNDRDQGTGNDGKHDDNGGGNDGPEGSQPRGQAHDGGHGSAPQQRPSGQGYGAGGASGGHSGH